MAFDERQPAPPGAGSYAGTPPPARKELQLLTLWGPDGDTNPNPNVDNAGNTLLTRESPLVSASSPNDSWWTIDLAAKEFEQHSAGVLVLPAASRANIIGNATSRDGSNLQVEVRYLSLGMGRRFLMDIAQGQRVSIFGSQLTVLLRSPPTSTIITKANQRTATATTPGVVLQTVVICQASCGYAPLGRRRATYTTTFCIGAGLSALLRVPAAVLSCECYVPDAAFAEAFRWVEAADAQDMGRVFFLNFGGVNAQRTGVVERPGNARFARVANGDAEERCFTFVWQLEF